MFSPLSIAWLVGWFLSRVAQNPLKRFPWNLGEDGSWPRIDRIIFWCRSRSRDGSRDDFLTLTLPDKVFSDIFINFSVNNVGILMKKMRHIYMTGIDE